MHRLNGNAARIIRVPAGAMLRRQRIAAGVVLVALLTSAADVYFEIGIFGRFSKKVMAATNFVALIWMLKYGPSIFRLRAYQRLRRRRLSKAESPSH
jgi:hypothetical protein